MNGINAGLAGRFRQTPYGRPPAFRARSMGMTPVMDSRFSPAFMSGLGCNKANGFPSTLELQTAALEEERQMTGLGCSKCKRTRKQALLMYELEGQRPRVVMGQVCPLQQVDANSVNCQRTSTGDIVCSNGFIYSGDCPKAPQPNLPGIAEDVNGIPKIPPPPGGEMPSYAPPATSTPTSGAPQGAPVGVLPIVIGGVAVAGVAILLSVLS